MARRACDLLLGDLVLYADGELGDAARERAVAAHLESCSDCCALLDAHDALTRRLLASGGERESVSSGDPERGFYLAWQDDIRSRGAERAAGSVERRRERLWERLEREIDRQRPVPLRGRLEALAALAAAVVLGIGLALAARTERAPEAVLADRSSADAAIPLERSPESTIAAGPGAGGLEGLLWVLAESVAGRHALEWPDRATHRDVVLVSIDPSGAAAPPQRYVVHAAVAPADVRRTLFGRRLFLVPVDGDPRAPSAMLAMSPGALAARAVPPGALAARTMPPGALAARAVPPGALAARAVAIEFVPRSVVGLWEGRAVPRQHAPGRSYRVLSCCGANDLGIATLPDPQREATLWWPGSTAPRRLVAPLGILGSLPLDEPRS